MIQVLVADDEAMVRAGVRAILATDGGVEVVAEAADGHQAVELVRVHRPHVALLDIRMPGLDGLAAADEIAVVAPATRVIMLTTFGQDDYIARALGGGAAGFLLKASDPREVISAVHAVAGGAAFLSPTVAHRVIRRYRDVGVSATQARQRVDTLTERERDVLALLGAGHSNAEIAHTLYIVEGTVKAHVSSILDKLGARNRVQAAVLAYEAGLT
ncbi:DNA-binding NarL/FixJ family response regulator [Saccharothrix tamanrassetensis]|uniref:DNA-binding NarL/FixJ family response regulator n=1 Tax=Saccharothrix tamanrassetensis TaxID=1051531 RepID=A0A841CIH6_9PSEU|nr:response regulator transcription factor [Saccharothrix tamanrassetensis]MBB5957231.1 DNA-binding NarL/FixJ family response regulator [Saccharothrix tamanrassetensis]